MTRQVRVTGHSGRSNRPVSYGLQEGTSVSALRVREIRVDANGTAWRLRSLVAMGHDCNRLARALGVSPDMVYRVVSGQSKTVTPRLRELACQLWDAWWCYTPPVRTRSERLAIARARRLARRADWPCPLGLDEPDPQSGDLGLDDPGYRPYCHWRPARGLGVAPDFAPVTGPQRTREIA
jgi:hypothetical protein